MKKEQIKQRCEYSEEGLKTFGKQRRGYVLGESKDGRFWHVLLDDLNTPHVYLKDFININPLDEYHIRHLSPQEKKKHDWAMNRLEIMKI